MNQVSLKKYFTKLLKEREKLFASKLKAQKIALKLFTTELNKKLEHLNKLREDVLTDRSILLEKDIYNADKELMNKKIDGINGTLKVLVPVATVIGGIIGAIIVTFFK